MLFIGRYLSPVQQGYYFTFSNIISLSIFLELGLGTILTQFASYEYAYLNWKDGRLEGDPNSLNRLLSLGRKTFLWYTIMSLLFTAIIIPSGIVFFKGNHDEVHYTAPWICLVLFSSANLVLYAFTSIMEGCNKVSDVQLMKLVQSLVGNVFIWILLLSGMGLFAAAALAIVQFVLTVIWISRKYWPIVNQIYHFNKRSKNQISWKKEILPLQWKIGLSWISGYVIFQSINPMLFKYRGAIEAGKMGMSLSLANIAQVVGLAWLSTKIPTYGTYINQNKIKELKQMIKRNTIISVCVSVIVSFFIVITLLLANNYYPKFNSRVLPIISIVFLSMASAINLIITSIASYLRSFKKEPFLINSIVGAIFTGAAITLSVLYKDANFLCMLIFLINLFVGLPLAFTTFFRTEKVLIKNRLNEQ
jgi:O-antigen/teichoic acid export membrane protein